ncbi:MAG: AMP-binding protein [Methylococcaceae bacterium]|nr:AMP-binding protein [Methylococcaceae bacterium]
MSASALWKNIESLAEKSAGQIAIIGEERCYTYFELQQAIQDVAQKLTATPHRVIAFYSDNSPAWIVIDLACHLTGITLLPLPRFFSEQQLQHAIQQAGATAVLHHKGDRVEGLVEMIKQRDLVLTLTLTDIKTTTAQLPEQTAKITFTSGSTGQPKGVCLSEQQQLSVAKSLLQTTKLTAPRHLSILPFSTLLENIGGIYAPLLSGGTIIALSQETLGFNGSNGFELKKLITIISDYEPESMILFPELLLALIGAINQGWLPPKSLQFIAVGGSKVSASLLQDAEKLGLPVYQGYGLSECASVVSLNSPSESRPSSVGKVLSHVNIAIEQGEIVVSGNTFLGYVNEPNSWLNLQVFTGDLGFFDQDNYLHISGRKKNVLISSFGRNINPEWLESELLSNGLLQQCVVFGDAKPYCVALVYPRDITCDNQTIETWIDRVNQSLPDYAQIKKWAYLKEPLSFTNGLMTSNGRPVRNAISHEYSALIEKLYIKD